MSESCPKHTQNMSNTYPTNTPYIPNTYPKYNQEISKTYPNHTIPGIHEANFLETVEKRVVIKVR